MQISFRWAAFGLALVALVIAVWASLSGEAPSPAPPPEAAETLRLEQRLEDAEARLVRSSSGETTRRLEPPAAPLAVVGGVEAETPPHFVGLAIRLRGSLWRWEESHCAGALFRGGWILTAAHCVDPPWEYVEASVGPATRAAWGLERARFGAAVQHSHWEACSPSEPRCRNDLALLRLPAEAAAALDWAALDWPQGPQTQLEPGERVRVCGMGRVESGELSEALRCVEQSVVEVRPGVVQLDGSAGGFRQADSGALVVRAATGAPVGVVAYFHGGGMEGEQFLMPFPTRWAAGVRAAWRAEP